MATDGRRLSKKAKPVSIDSTEDAELVRKLATSEDDVGTELLDAIHSDDLGTIRRLVKKHAFTNADIVKICTSDVKHALLKTTACPLVEASRLQDAAIVSYFLFAGADANHLHEKALKGGHVTTVTPLHAAVDAASHAVADALLQAGANANVSDHRGETPLLAATRLADQNMVKLLLSKGANPAIADRQHVAPLHIGTLYGHTEIVRSLVDSDADVWQRGQGGITPPQIAAREGHTHLAELFCRRGRRDINEVSAGFAPGGRSVALLHITAQYARYDTASMLIREFRADVNVRDSVGNTPLHCLTAYENSRSTVSTDTVARTAELLITKGADVTATNDVGDTPLHVAAQQHPEPALLQTLVAAGADPHSPNANHMTPFDLLPKTDPAIKAFLQPTQEDRQMVQDVSIASVPMVEDPAAATGSLKRSGSKKKKDPKVSEDATKVPESKPEVPEKRRKSSSRSSKSIDDSPKKPQPETEDDSKRLSLERAVPLVDAPESEMSTKLSLNELDNLRSRASDPRAPQVTNLDDEIEPDLGPLPEPPRAKPRYNMELDLDRNVPVAGRPFSGRYSGIEMPMSPAPPPPDTLPPSPPKSGYEGDEYLPPGALDQLVPEISIDINKNKIDEPLYLNVSGDKDAIKPQRVDVVSAKKKPVAPHEETPQPVATEQLVAVAEPDKKPIKRKKSKSDKDKPVVAANVVDPAAGTEERLHSEVHLNVEAAPVHVVEPKQTVPEEGAVVIDDVIQPMKAEKTIVPHKANKRYKSMEALELEPLPLPDSPVAGAKSTESVPKTGLSIKVEGDVPKAYDKASVNAARKAFLLAPIGYAPPSQDDRIRFGTDVPAAAAKPAEVTKPTAPEQKVSDMLKHEGESSDTSGSSSSSDSESDDDTENEIDEMVAATLRQEPERDDATKPADSSLPASENYVPKIKAEKKVTLVPPKSDKVPDNKKAPVEENYVPLANKSGDPATLPRLPKKSQVSEKQPATQELESEVKQVAADKNNQEVPRVGSSDQPPAAAGTQEGLAFALPSVRSTPLTQRSVKPVPTSATPFKQLSLRDFGNQIIEPEPVVFNEQFSPRRPADGESEQAAAPLQLAYRLPGSSLASLPTTDTSAAVSDSWTGTTEGSFDTSQPSNETSHSAQKSVSRDSSMKGTKKKQTPQHTPAKAAKGASSSDEDDYDENMEEWPEKEDNILGETFHTRRLDLSGSPLDDMLVRNATVEPTIPMELIAEEPAAAPASVADDTVPFADDEESHHAGQLPAAVLQAELVSVGSSDGDSSSSDSDSSESSDEDDDDIGYQEFVDDLHASHGQDDSSMVEHAENRPSSSIGATIEQGNVKVGSKPEDHPFQPDVVITSLSSGSETSSDDSSSESGSEDEEGAPGLEYTVDDISAAAGSEALNEMLVGPAATEDSASHQQPAKPAALLLTASPKLRRDKSPTSYMRIEETYTLEAKTVTKTTLIQQGYVQSAEDLVMQPLNGRRPTDLLNELPSANARVNIPAFDEVRTPSFSDEPFMETEVTIDETTSESYLVSEEISLLPEQFDENEPVLDEPAAKSKRRSKRLSKNIPPPENDAPASDFYINFPSTSGDVSASASDVNASTEPVDLSTSIPVKPKGKADDKPADLYINLNAPRLPKSVDVSVPDLIDDDDLNVSIPSTKSKPVTGDVYANIPLSREEPLAIEPQSAHQVQGRSKPKDLYMNLPEKLIDISVDPPIAPADTSLKRNADSRKTQRKSKSPKRGNQDSEPSEEPSAELSMPASTEVSLEVPVVSVELPVKVEVEEPTKGRKPSSKVKKSLDVEARADDVKATVMDVLRDAEQNLALEIPHEAEEVPKTKRKKSKSREALAAGFDISVTEPESIGISSPAEDVALAGDLDISVSSQEPTRKSRSKLKPSKRSKENLALLDDLTAPAVAVEVAKPEISFSDDTAGRPDGKKSKRKSKSPNTSRGKISLPLSELDINIDAQAASVDDQPAYVNIGNDDDASKPLDEISPDDLAKTKRKKSKSRERPDNEEKDNQPEEQPVGELDEEPKLRKKKSKSREKLVPEGGLQIQLEHPVIDDLNDEPNLRKKKSKSREKLTPDIELHVQPTEDTTVGSLEEEPKLRKKKSKSREKLFEEQTPIDETPVAITLTNDVEPTDETPARKLKKSPGTSRKKISLPVVDLDLNVDTVPPAESGADDNQPTYLNLSDTQPEGQREGRGPEFARNESSRKSHRKSKSPRRRSEENLTLPLSVAQPSNETFIDEPSTAPSDSVSFITDPTLPSEDPVSDVSMLRDDANRKSTRRKGKSPKRSSGSSEPLSPTSVAPPVEYVEELYILESKVVKPKGFTMVAEDLWNNAPTGLPAVVPLVVDPVATRPKSSTGDDLPSPNKKQDGDKKRRSKSPASEKGKVSLPTADPDLDLDVDIALPDPSTNAFADQPTYVNVSKDDEDPSSSYVNLGDKIPPVDTDKDVDFARSDSARKSSRRKSKSPKSRSRENLASSAAPSSTDEASSIIPTDASFVAEAASPSSPPAVAAAAAAVVNDQLIREDPLRKSHHRKSKSPRRDSGKSPNETAAFFPQDTSFTAPTVTVEEVYILEGKVKVPRGYVAVAEALYFDAPAEKPADEEPSNKDKPKQSKKSPNKEQEDALPIASLTGEPGSELGKKQRRSKSPNASRGKVRLPSAELDVNVDLPEPTAGDDDQPKYVNINQKPEAGLKSPGVIVSAPVVPVVETDLDALMDADAEQRPVNASVNSSTPGDTSTSFDSLKKPKKDKKKPGDGVEASLDLPVIGGGKVKADLPVIGSKAELPVIGGGKADDQLVKIATSPGSKRRDIKRPPAGQAGNTDSLPRPPTQKELDQLAREPSAKTPTTSSGDTAPVAVAVFVSIPVSPSSKTKPRVDLPAPLSTENMKPPLNEDDRRKKLVPASKTHEVDVDMPSNAGSVSFAEISGDVSRFVGDSFELSFENDRDKQPHANTLKGIGESEEPSDSEETESEEEEDEEPSHEQRVLPTIDASKVHADAQLKAPGFPAVDDLEEQVPVEHVRAGEDSDNDERPASAGSGGRLKPPVAKGNYYNLLHPEPGSQKPGSQREPEADLGSETSSDSEDDEEAAGQHPASEHLQRQPDADAERGKLRKHPAGVKSSSDEDSSSGDDEGTKEASGVGSGSSDITPTQRDILGSAGDDDLHPNWQNPLPPPPSSLLASTSVTSHLPSPPATPPPPPPEDEEEEETSDEESGEEGEGQVKGEANPLLHVALSQSLEDRRSQVAPKEEEEEEEGKSKSSEDEEEEEEEEEPGAHYYNVIPPPDKEDQSGHYYNVVPTSGGGISAKTAPLSIKVADNKPTEESDDSQSESESEDEEAGDHKHPPMTQATPGWKSREGQNAEMERVLQAVSGTKAQPQHQQPAYMGTPLSTDQSSASSPASHHSSTSNLSDRGLSPQQAGNKQSTPQQQQEQISPQRSSVQLMKVPAPQPQSILRRSPDGRSWQPSPVPMEPRSNTRSLQDAAYQSFLRSSPTRSSDTSRRTPEETVYVRGTYRPNTVTVWRGGGGLNTSRRLLGDNAGDESTINTSRMGDMGSMRGSGMPMGMGGGGGGGGGDGGVDEPLARSSHIPQTRASNRPASTNPELGLPPLNLDEDGEELDEDNGNGPPSPTPSRPSSYFAGPMPFQPAWMAGPFMMQPQQQQQQHAAQPVMMMMPMPFFVEPKVRPDAQGLDNYDSISRLWMEKNDAQTVRKALEQSSLGNSKNPDNRSTDSLASGADDRSLWRTAKARERGRQLRQMKRQLDQLAAQLPGGVKGGRPGSTTSFLGAPSDDGGRMLYDRLMASPSSNKEMLLLFRVSSNWKDLAWVLFDGIQSDSETIRMIEDIRLKHRRQLREQVEDMMQRWWRKRGAEATIDELQRALEVINMAYVTDEIDDKRRSELSMMPDVDLHDGTIYSQATCEHDGDYDDDANHYAEINDVNHHHDDDDAGDAHLRDPSPLPEPLPARRAPPSRAVATAKDHGRDDVSETSLTRVIPHPQAGADDVNLTEFPPLPPVPSRVAPAIPPKQFHEGDEETSAELQLVVPVEHQPVTMRSKKKKSKPPAPAPGVKAVEGRTPPPLPPNPPVTLSMEVPPAYTSTIETDL